MERHLDTGEDNLTVTQKVIRSDRRRERAVSEHKGEHFLSCTELYAMTSILALLEAFESNSSTNLALVVASIKLARSKAALEEAKNVAVRRSGARGADARQQLLRVESRVAEDEALYRVCSSEC